MNIKKRFEIPALLTSFNKELQSGKIQNDIYDFEFSHSGFPCLYDKRAGISKLFCHSLSYFTIYPDSN